MTDIHVRHDKLPAGFHRRTKAGKCPVPEDSRVELMIRTAEGIGSSGVTKAAFHDWSIAPSKVGGIVGYRLV